MKRILPFLITITLSFNGFAQVYNGDLTLSTQAEVNSFNYTEVTGQLTISEASSGEITNLNGLNTLTTIGDGLSIESNNALTNLNGLENITSIIGDYDSLGQGIGLKISNNSNLTTINAFSNLTLMEGNIHIENNPMLVSLIGLDGITEVNGSIRILDNANLNTLSGLQNIVTVTGVGFFQFGIRIEDNDALVDLTGLDGLTTLNGNLEVYGNDSLISLNGLNSLTNHTAVYEGIAIGGNSSLRSLNGLNNISSYNCSLTSIYNNNALVTLEGLPNLTEFNGTISIERNDALISLIGLNNISSILGGLKINSNENLISLEGLDNLVSVGGILSIGNSINSLSGYIYPGNISLTSLNNLSNLTYIGSELKITGCSSLTSLDGLENLNTIIQQAYYSTNNRVQIGYDPTDPGISPISNFYNPQLSDFCGIQRLVTLGEITPLTTIISDNANNPTLSEIESLNCELPPPSQTVFKWRTATNNGSTITETINGITATFSGSNLNITDVSQYIQGQYAGVGYDNVINASTNTNVTFSFSEPVDVISIMASNSYPNEITFTPNGGNNNVVSSNVDSSKIILNWQNITSFTVSTTGSYFGFDHLRTINSSSLSSNEYAINKIKLFPNPTKNLITIQGNTNISEASIYNIQGQKIDIKIKNNQINLINQASGVYFLQLKTDNGLITKKIIKH